MVARGHVWNTSGVQGIELYVVRGREPGRVIAVGDAQVLGRDKAADVSIDDEQASRRHARVRLDGDHAVIEDLDSTNGTFVNGERITGRRALHVGDVVRIGNTVLEVRRSADRKPAPDTRIARGVTRSREGPGVGATPVGRLVVMQGPGAGQALDIARPATIGRDPRCELVISDDEVSREHLRVGTEDGSAVVADIGAANGTFVNGERLIGRRRLAPGDRLDIGQAVLQYQGLEDRRNLPVLSIVRPTRLRDIRAQPAGAGTPTSTRKWWTLGVVCTTVAMLFLDTTIVAVALPAITKGLHANFSELQWVIDAYALALAVALLTAGSLSDIVGRRHVLVSGIVVFTIFSAACGLAPSALALDVFRGAQGIGGAMMLATSLALIAQEFPPGERAVAYGAWGATVGASAGIGPLVGGALTTGLGWQWIFYVNVPIGIVAAIVTLRKLVNLPGPKTKVDGLGLITFSASMFLLLFGVIRGNDYGWESPTIVGSFIAAIVLGGLFIAIESRVRTPMLPLRLFRIPTLNGAALAAFCLSASAFALLPYLTLWMQSVLGYSAFAVGLRLLPLSILGILLSPTLGRLESRFSPQAMIAAGLVAFAVGLALMARINATSGWTVLLPGLCLIGVGQGALNIPLEGAAVGVLPSWQSGLAAGVNTTFRQLGLATGVAALGAMLQTEVLSNVRRDLTGTSLAHQATDLASSITAGQTQVVLSGLPAHQRSLVAHAARVGFSAGLSEACIVAAVIATIGAVGAAVLIRRRDMVVYSPPAIHPSRDPAVALEVAEH